MLLLLNIKCSIGSPAWSWFPVSGEAGIFSDALLCSPLLSYQRQSLQAQPKGSISPRSKWFLPPSIWECRSLSCDSRMRLLGTCNVSGNVTFGVLCHSKHSTWFWDCQGQEHHTCQCSVRINWALWFQQMPSGWRVLTYRFQRRTASLPPAAETSSGYLQFTLYSMTN